MANNNSFNIHIYVQIYMFMVYVCLWKWVCTANGKQEVCVGLWSVCLCLLLPLKNKKKSGRRLLCGVIVTGLTQCLLRMTTAALLIACLCWMMGYLIPTHSTQLLFTVAEAWGGSGGFLWPYGEGGRAQAEWSGVHHLIPAPEKLLYCMEAADWHGSQRD